MMDLLFENGDLAVIQGDLGLCSNDIQAITQAILIRLKTLQGEWFMDTKTGIPYLSEILGRKTNQRFLSHIFAQQIKSIPGVDDVSDFSLNEGPERKLDISLKIKLTDQREISISETVEI